LLGDSSPKPFVIENLIINSILLASYNFIFLALTLLQSLDWALNLPGLIDSDRVYFFNPQGKGD
jgi:hypothetical protein